MRRYEDNIKITFKETRSEGVDRLQVPLHVLAEGHREPSGTVKSGEFLEQGSDY
jgi:hypothetical protein